MRLDDPRGHSHRCHVVRNVANHRGSGTNDRPVSHFAALNNAASDANECPFSYLYPTSQMDTRGDMCVIVDDALMIDSRTGVDDDMATNARFGLNHRASKNYRSLSYLHRRVYPCVWMYDCYPLDTLHLYRQSLACGVITDGNYCTAIAFFEQASHSTGNGHTQYRRAPCGRVVVEDCSCRQPRSLQRADNYPGVPSRSDNGYSFSVGQVCDFS